MAVAKIHAIKSTVGKSVDYITNPEKTILADGTQLVSSFGCVPETAEIEFNLTCQLAKEIKGDYTKSGGGNNLAYHLIQSFSVEDSENLTPEQVHQLGIEFADRFLGGKYEYVIATHIDKGHLHNHIIFNSTSYKDYKKFRSEPYKTVAKIREISDNICEENGLSIIKTKGLPKSYIEWKFAKEGKLTWKETIKNKIDEVIPQVKSYSEFLEKMKSAGIEVKEGKHIAFRAPEQERFIRGKRIGEEYTKENIISRIADNKNLNNVKNIEISKNNIFKQLTNGVILLVPNQDYLLYLDSDSATVMENTVMVNLSGKEYTTMTKGLVPNGKVTEEQIAKLYDNQTAEKAADVIDNYQELPLEEYIKLRQSERTDRLHRAAEAVAYSRGEGVIYYSDFSKVLSTLRDKSYETKHTLMQLDQKIMDIKNVGKLLVTYEKYLPIRQELENIKFAKFKRQKFLNKHQLDLASLAYAEEQLIELGIDPQQINKDDLINQIKNNEIKIDSLETQVDSIQQRIDKLSEAQNVIDEFVTGRETNINIQRKAERKQDSEIEV